MITENTLPSWSVQEKRGLMFLSYRVSNLFPNYHNSALFQNVQCGFTTGTGVEAMKCKDDKEARALGIEWCINQCRELIAYGFRGYIFYTVGAVENVKEVAAAVY